LHLVGELSRPRQSIYAQVDAKVKRSLLLVNMSTEADPEIDDAYFIDDAILRDPSNDPTPQPTPQPTTNINAYTQSPSRFLTLFPTKPRVLSTETPSSLVQHQLQKHSKELTRMATLS
jgi:hypothetical protein